MKTLAEILKNTKSSAVIFGHINRRQQELKPVFVSLENNRRTRIYDTASATELLDFHFIKSFYEQLNVTGCGFQTFDQVMADLSAEHGFAAAIRNAGITEKETSDNRRAAVDAWWTVQFGSVRGCEAYDKIVAAEQRAA
ncbi:hypothetical protein ASD54_08825 [Rhizobium sp. Root149]|uniref:hypothetical protein n=1 Tax=Rhizobium sp. Root149 TaxID=1736473 RepID=UPI00071440B2|nr:hypothetical protein [Rhizobium sp. Root149]KQZ50347.1 hypothetical protein ASD54_08825 [Rhizobium sp. Root149]